jgi:hypothetical protein
MPAPFVGANAGEDQRPYLFRRASQRRLRVQRPRKSGSEHHDLNQSGQVRSRTIAPDLAAFLPENEDFRQQAAADAEALLQFRADRGARCMGRVNRPMQGGAFAGLPREFTRQLREGGQHRSFFSAIARALDEGYALSSQCRQDMLFRPEIIKKRSLADVGGLRNVFHGGFKKAVLRKKAQRGAKKAVADFGAVPFTPARGRGGIAGDLGERCDDVPPCVPES